MAYTEHKTILSTFSKGFVDDVIPHDSSPERREGVRRLSSHIISPRGLTEGEIAVGVWKKGAGADPITGYNKGGTKRLKLALLQDDDVKDEVAELFEALIEKRVNDKLQQGGFVLSELDRTLIRRENELKVLRNVSSHFHKAVNDAQVKNKYNKKLLSLKAEKVLHNNHQASKSTGFNLEVRDALQRAPAPNTPSASTSVTQKDAVVRLSAAEQVISETEMFKNLGSAYVSIEKAYTAFNAIVHQSITPQYASQVRQWIEEGRFEEHGAGVGQVIKTMLEVMESGGHADLC